MTDIKFATKAAYVAALKARRKDIVAYDKRRLAEHRAAEKEALDAVRARCRELVKLSYADLKAEYEKTFNLVRFNAPACPISGVAQLERLLATLAVTTQESFTVKDGTPAHHLLVGDLTGDEKGMCK